MRSVSHSILWCFIYVSLTFFYLYSGASDQCFSVVSLFLWSQHLRECFVSMIYIWLWNIITLPELRRFLKLSSIVPSCFTLYHRQKSLQVEAKNIFPHRPSWDMLCCCFSKAFQQPKKFSHQFSFALRWIKSWSDFSLKSRFKSCSLSIFLLLGIVCVECRHKFVY